MTSLPVLTRALRIFAAWRIEYWKNPQHYMTRGLISHQWKSALYDADVRVRWEAAEQAGRVRLKIELDDVCNLDDLFGDCYNPAVNTDIPAERLERERQAEIERVNREGVWGIVGQYKCPTCGNWTTADSVWGFIGEDWQGLGSDTNVMAATLEKIGK